MFYYLLENIQFLKYKLKSQDNTRCENIIPQNRMSVPLHRPFVREVYILVITTRLVRPEISKKLTLPPLEVAGYEAMFILLLLMLPLHCDGTVHCLDGDLIGGELLDI